MGVGPNEATKSEWWTADPFAKASSGLYDDRYTFNADGTFTFSAGDDMAVSYTHLTLTTKA